MIYPNEIRTYISDVAKLRPDHRTVYADRYDLKRGSLYLKNSVKQARSVVIHPDMLSALAAADLPGIILPSSSDDLYHRSTLTKFPRLIPGSEPCGYELGFENPSGLAALLAFMRSAPESSALEDIAAIAPTLVGLPATERDAIIAARLGQGRFRTRLLHAWSESCAVTGRSVAPLLRASHIKPWRLSDHAERLDPENGLLLIANLDAAFDARLLSFSDDGEMVFSPKLGPNPHEVLGIALGSRLTRCPSSRQRAFLKHHRVLAELD